MFVDIFRKGSGKVRRTLTHSAHTAIPKLSTQSACPSDNLQRHLYETFNGRDFFEVETCSVDGFV